MKTISDLGPEASQLYQANQQIREEQSAQLQASSQVSAVTRVESMTPVASEILALTGLDRVRRSFASLPAPAGFGLVRLGVFGSQLAGSLGDTARLRQLLESTEALQEGKKGPSAQAREAVVTGLKRLADSSEMHDEIQLQTAEFMKG